MFQRIQLIVACCLLACSPAAAQVGIDFRSAVESAGPATIAVNLTSDVVDRPIAQTYRRQFLDLTGLVPDRRMFPLDPAPVRSGFAVASDLVISCEIPNDEVTLVTHDGNSVSGQVVARDAVTGLIAIRVPDGNWNQGLALAADPVEPGMPVLINWLDGGKTLTSQASMIATRPNSRAPEIGFAVSLDADFDPQKLGAPVVNSDGALVGVLVNIGGVSLCLPSTHVARLIEAASRQQPSDLRRGRLGIRLDESRGPVASDVTADTPAHQAGLQAGDEIVKIDGRLCRTYADVMAAVAMSRAGDEVELEVQRGDEKLVLTVKLAAIDFDPKASRYLGGFFPGRSTQIYQYKDGKILPLDQQNSDDVIQFNNPRQLMYGNLEVERSRLEESIKVLEAEKKRQDEMIKRLREEMAKKEPVADPSAEKSIEKDIARLEKIIEEIKERLLKVQPDN